MLLENEYKKMQGDKRIISTRSNELSEAVIIGKKGLSNVVSDFKSNMSVRIKELRANKITEKELYDTIFNDLKSIGLSKQEAALLTKSLVK